MDATKQLHHKRARCQAQEASTLDGVRAGNRLLGADINIGRMKLNCSMTRKDNIHMLRSRVALVISRFERLRIRNAKLQSKEDKKC